VARLDEELERLRWLIDTGRLADGAGLVGIELELHLIDDHGRPSPHNDAVLAGLASSGFDLQSELARFNVEVNLPPVALTDWPLSAIRRAIDGARIAASSVVAGSEAVSIGTLPTLEESDVTVTAISDQDRYHVLDERIMTARGEGITLTIDGRDACGERLEVLVDSITLEGAATSLQVHLDLPGDGFVAAWNVAQAVAALQVAAAANSPVVLGRKLWHETRVPLFEQVIDARSAAEREPGSPHARPPRVWFGSRWIEHPIDLFVENLAQFNTPLVDDGRDHPVADDELSLAALATHNGTVWRWNRPVYAVLDGRPTLRIENRVLSAPPTAVDAAADVALFSGLVAGLRDDVDALTTRMPFTDATENFRSAARHGLGAPLRWPGMRGTTTASELLVDGLIELAADGLAVLGVPDAESGPALDIIAARASEGRNGAVWQLAVLAHEELHHDRRTALQRMLLRYRELQQEGEPVHRWPLPGGALRPNARADVTA
jgi:hypothetical protein